MNPFKYIVNYQLQVSSLDLQETKVHFHMFSLIQHLNFPEPYTTGMLFLSQLTTHKHKSYTLRSVFWPNLQITHVSFKEDTSNWKHIPCSWIKITDIVSTSRSFKVINRLSRIPIKIPMGLFTEVKKKS